jgi:hypothetical protein
LPSDVLIAGGNSGYGNPATAAAEVYDEKSGAWVPVASMTSSRLLHTATLLPDGKVLMVGGATRYPAGAPTNTAEIYDPAGGQFAATSGNLADARYRHSATLLGDGRVLIVGGWGENGALASAELYDPVTQTFSPAGNMQTARERHAAVAFDGGNKVLVVGGLSHTYEIWDSASNGFTAQGQIPSVQEIFPDPVTDSAGNRMIVGGMPYSDYYEVTAAEQLLNPETQSFTAGKNLNEARSGHTLTALAEGTQLVAGGFDGKVLGSAELRKPSGWTTLATALVTARTDHTATLLSNGGVLIAGGTGADGSPLASTEIYDPATQSFKAGPSTGFVRFGHTAISFVPKNVATSTTLASSPNPSHFREPNHPDRHRQSR